MNTSFKPSEFDKQAAASLDMIDEEAAKKRVDAILHPKAGPTLTPAPMTEWSRYVNTLTPASQTQPAGRRTPTVTVSDGHGGQFTVADPHLEEFPKQRKKRSDAGIPKGPKKIDRGWITTEQAAHLDKLLRAVVACEATLRDAEKRYMEYLDELTIKK